MAGQPCKLIEGDPIQVGQRQLIPIVKARSIIRRQVTFGTGSSHGSGGGLVWLRPVAVIERRSDGSEERITIPDGTWMAIKGMLLGALALPVVYVLVASLAFWWRKSRSRSAVSGSTGAKS